MNHATAQGNNTVQDPITISVTGLDTVVNTAVLNITIVDDVPTAVADVNSVKEDDTDAPGYDDSNPDTSIIVGNISANDTEGADRSTPITAISSVNTGNVGSIGSTFSGAYGTLELQADGSYVYTLDNNNVDVQHISDGETLTETFSYTIEDADGDSSTTTLTITINGTGDDPFITPDAPKIVYEEALNVPGDDQGTDPGSNGEFAYGQIAIVAKDGLNNVVIAGTTVTEAQPVQQRQ